MIGPLLVTGASGALGDAFVRIASRRGRARGPARKNLILAKLFAPPT